MKERRTAANSAAKGHPTPVIGLGSIDFALGLIEELRKDLQTARAALEPFAKLAEGRDRWKPTDNCGRFPSVAEARAAREALKRLKLW